MFDRVSEDLKKYFIPDFQKKYGANFLPTI